MLWALSGLRGVCATPTSAFGGRPDWGLRSAYLAIVSPASDSPTLFGSTRANGEIMKLTRTVTAMVALIVAPHANATTDASRVQILDAQIADASRKIS